MYSCAPECYLTRSHHFYAVGVDLHQKVLLIKEIGLNFVNKYRTKQPSLFQANDACIIKDTEDAAQASCQVSHTLPEPEWSSDM